MIRAPSSGAVVPLQPSRPLIGPGTAVPAIPTTPAWGSVFVPTSYIGRFMSGSAALSSYNRFLSLLNLAKEKGCKALTVYLEVQNSGALTFSLSKFGILTINLSEMTKEEMRTIMEKSAELGIYLDLHAPWLSGAEGRGGAQEVKDKFSYPDPKNNPAIFKGILEFCELYKETTGRKMELTIHTTGNPEDWASWINQAGKHCVIQIENGFKYADMEQPKGASYPADGFSYFNASRPYKQAEYLDWVKQLIRAVNNPVVEIRALIDIAHAAAAENDPLAYLYFIRDAFKITDVTRIHLASVNLEGTILSQRDDHGKLPEFSREAVVKQAQALGRYGELAETIKLVFDHIEKLQQKNEFGITAESKVYFA